MVCFVKKTKIKFLACCISFSFILCTFTTIYIYYSPTDTSKISLVTTATNSLVEFQHDPNKRRRTFTGMDHVDDDNNNILKTHVEQYLCPLCVHVCVVTCGERAEEVSQVVKSTLLHRCKDELIWFHIFTDDISEPKLNKFFKSIPQHIINTFNYTLYNITYPTHLMIHGTLEEWKQLFRPCATQRLFLPIVLPHVDSIIYLDSDNLVLESVQILWNYFHLFNSSQLSAVTNEHESSNVGWYNRFARHPFYGKLGVNSGVMLMNLTRLRQTDYMYTIVKLYQKYKLNITFGDQDLLNIIFSIHPDWIYQLDCQWNYRSDLCIYGVVCVQPDQKDELRKALILHGSRGIFHNDKQPTFKAIYNIIKHVDFNISRDEIIMELSNYQKMLYTAQCGQELII